MIAEPHSIELVEAEAARVLECQPDEVETDPLPNIGYWTIGTRYNNGDYDYTAYYRSGEKRAIVQWYTTSQDAQGRVAG